MANIDETKIIDREVEAEIFARMLECKTPRRVLVVSDRAGMGKSDVLRKLRYMCEYIHDVPVALIRLQEFESLPDVFGLVSRLREALGVGGAVFPSFDALKAALDFGDSAQFSERLHSIHGVADLRGAQVSGTARVAATMFNFNIEHAEHVALPPWNEEAKDAARTLCVEAFLTDLLAYSREHRVVLLFDTIEKAGETLQRWLFLELLRKRVLSAWEAHRLIVALAGQGVAELLDGRLRPEERDCVEPIASLSTWEVRHVAEFLAVHGFDSLTPVEIQSIHSLLGDGYNLHGAILLAGDFVARRPRDRAATV